MVRVMSTKLSEELIASLGVAAEARGVTRNHLVREALEAVVEGRVRHLTEEELKARRLRALRESLTHVPTRREPRPGRGDAWRSTPR